MPHLSAHTAKGPSHHRQRDTKYSGKGCLCKMARATNGHLGSMPDRCYWWPRLQLHHLREQALSKKVQAPVTLPMLAGLSLLKTRAPTSLQEELIHSGIVTQQGSAARQQLRQVEGVDVVIKGPRRIPPARGVALIRPQTRQSHSEQLTYQALRNRGL